MAQFKGTADDFINLLVLFVEIKLIQSLVMKN